jgi:hypothetical protein
MSKIKLNLRKLPIQEKIAKARTIVTSLTGNPNFPTPSPTLVLITGAIDALETAAATVQADKAKLKTDVSAQSEKEDSLDQLITQLAGYIQSVAGDDETKILSAGLDTKAKASSAAEPTLPEALTPTAGDHDGEVDLSWDPVPRAKSYIIEFSVDPPTDTSWKHAGVSPRSSFTVTGLTPGTRYWFRVAAVSTGGQSGWSDPAMKIAP